MVLAWKPSITISWPGARGETGGAMRGKRQAMIGFDSIPASPYHYGFDYLRAFMSLAVVAWHLRVFGLSGFFDPEGYRHHFITFSDIINMQVLLLAVPVFFLVSLFLYFEHGAMDNHYFVRRVRKIAGLYGFWLAVFLVIYGCSYGFSSLVPVGGWDLLRKIISGWGSLYYFFFSLLLLTCLARFIAPFPRRLVWLLLAVSLAVLWVMDLLVKSGVTSGSLVAYWNPVNFLPYLFLARLFADYNGRQDLTSNPFPLALFILLTMGCVLAAVGEWHWLISGHNFAYNDCALPCYTRVSLALGAAIVFRLSWFIRYRPNYVVRFLADYSLGLYCLHGYASWFLYHRLVATPDNHGATVMAFGLIVLISLLVSMVLRSLLGRELI